MAPESAERKHIRRLRQRGIVVQAKSPTEPGAAAWNGALAAEDARDAYLAAQRQREQQQAQKMQQMVEQVEQQWEQQQQQLRQRSGAVKATSAGHTATGLQQVSSSAAAGAFATPAVASAPLTNVVADASLFLAACLLLLLPLRLLSALLMPQLDCDETFNYWEPLHYLLFGRGLQTWEYSPVYGLRSYAYLWLISPAAWLGQAVHSLLGGGGGAANGAQEVNKLVLFYSVRASFAVACALCETRLLLSVRRVLGTSIARWMLLFLALAPGMAHAPQAFLPQTFTMMAVMLTLDAWMNRNYRSAIFFTGVCSLVGWPFSVLLSLPLALEVLFAYRGVARLLQPIKWGLASAAICVLPCLVVDFAYYRRFVFAILNIAVYNSGAQSEHGANLYGREPFSFYVHNLILNWNVAALAALAAPVLLPATWACRRAAAGGNKGASGGVSEFSVLRLLVPLFLWLAIFASMPHKEERFLFVIYPYMAFAAAISAFIVQRALQGCFAPFSPAHWPQFSSTNALGRSLAQLFQATLVMVFVLLSLARTQSLLVNYRAPLQVWSAVHARAQHALVDPSLLPFPLEHVRAGSEVSPASDAATSSSASVSTDAPEVVNVCVGKEWYRFPSHFLLPSLRLPSVSEAGRVRQLDYTLRFLPSDFGGLLPKAYLQEHEWAAQRHANPKDAERVEALSVPAPLQRLLNSTGAPSGGASSLLAPYLPSLFASSILRHLSSRPGTFVPPSGMNDWNRQEDEGRFVHQAELCHYIVDLALPGNKQKEPAYAEHEVKLPAPAQVAGQCVEGWKWRVVYAAPFLDAEASPNALLRAFFIPGLSDKANVMRPYQLLQREPILCAQK